MENRYGQNNRRASFTGKSVVKIYPFLKSLKRGNKRVFTSNDHGYYVFITGY